MISAKPRRPWVGVQLHLGQPFDIGKPTQPVTKERVQATLGRLADILPVDGVFIGFSSDPALYPASIDAIRSLGAEAYLWHGLLADVGRGLSVPQDAYMINHLGETNGKYGEIAGENFQFICPNHPFIRDVLIPKAVSLVEDHGFQGIFIDRIRYPSLVTGLDNQFCCFCDWCQQRASEQGLDMLEVKSNVHRFLAKISEMRGGDLDELAERIRSGSIFEFFNCSGLAAFYEFRERSIASVAKEVHRALHPRGKRVGLDLFSPSLGPLVSQNYSLLEEGGDWIKAMTYCFAKGPASLPLEVALLMEAVEGLNPHLFRQSLANLANAIFGLEVSVSWGEQKSIGPATGIVTAEFLKARSLVKTQIPIYFGFEAVNMPGICDVDPPQMAEYADAIRKAHLDGFVLCWTLPLMAEKNIRVFGELLKSFYSS